MSGRGITKKILAAYDATAGQNTYDAGTVTILAAFPRETFAHAPGWSPGPSFRTCIEQRSWMWERSDGRVEAVAVVWPRDNQPAWDGSSEWTDDEVWHVVLPTDLIPGIGDLYDKPHRVGWLGDPRHDSDGRILNRAPLTSHPLGRVRAWWDGFEKHYGFTPRLLDYDESLLASGRPWLTLSNQPDPGKRLPWLINAAVWLHRQFGAEIRVYPWDETRRETTNPFRYATLYANPHLTFSTACYEGSRS